MRTVVFDGPVDLDEFDGYLRQLEQWMAAGVAYGLIYDTRTAAIPSRSIRVRKGEWLKVNRARLEELATPIAFVIENAAMRFVLSSIFVLGPMTRAYSVVSTVEQAHAYIEETLASRADRSSAV